LRKQAKSYLYKHTSRRRRAKRNQSAARLRRAQTGKLIKRWLGKSAWRTCKLKRQAKPRFTSNRAAGGHLASRAACRLEATLAGEARPASAEASGRRNYITSAAEATHDEAENEKSLATLRGAPSINQRRQQIMFLRLSGPWQHDDKSLAADGVAQHRGRRRGSKHRKHRLC